LDHVKTEIIPGMPGWASAWNNALFEECGMESSLTSSPILKDRDGQRYQTVPPPVNSVTYYDYIGNAWRYTEEEWKLERQRQELEQKAARNRARQENRALDKLLKIAEDADAGFYGNWPNLFQHAIAASLTMAEITHLGEALLVHIHPNVRV